MVFLLLSVFVYFRRCHHFVRTLCVWFPHRSNVVCLMAGLTKMRQQPVEALEGSVWWHILTRGPWDSEAGQAGPFPGVCQLLLCVERVRTSCLGAALRAVLKAPQCNDPKSVPQVTLGGSGWHGQCDLGTDVPI